MSKKSPDSDPRTLDVKGILAQHPELQAVLYSREDDLIEDLASALLTHTPQLHPGARGAFDINPILTQLLQSLGPVFAAMLLQAMRPRPQLPPAVVVPPPVIHPAPDIPPVIPTHPVPPPTAVVPSGFVHRIVGGKFHLTGMHERGAGGPPMADDWVRAVLAGERNAPHDCWLAMDFTPEFEDGHIGQPSGPGEPDDPYFALTPDCPKAPYDTDGPMQKARLRFEYEGGGSADLGHEYAKNGCEPRIRCRPGDGSGGSLFNIRIEFLGGSVPLLGAAEVIHIGRGA